jgi:LmbE family N-acetylglucosaminyl deacetylase
VESLQGNNKFPESLSRALDETKPEIVFVPFWIDNHTDHRAVNTALAALSKKKRYQFLIYAYPVWFPLYPNVLSDISNEWEAKKKAISCYRSQLATRDYITMSRSLGQYWACVKGRGISVAETFFKSTVQEYVALGKKLGMK